MSQHLTLDALDEKLPWICRSPHDAGRLEVIVARPTFGQRAVQEVAELSLVEGLVGDNWQARGSRRTAGGTAHPEMQIAIMNARVIGAIAQERERWPLAGDQLFIDLDLSVSNLPPGQQVVIGTAVLEITPMVHSGCATFSGHFGQDALRWVNSHEGRALRLRGVYARVVRPGVVRPGDVVIKR